MFNIQEYASHFHIHEKLFSIKNIVDEAIYEIAEDEADELFHSKNICVPIMIVGLGNTVFVRQLKLIWQSQKINVKKIFPEKEESIFKHTLKHCVFASHTF